MTAGPDRGSRPLGARRGVVVVALLAAVVACAMAAPVLASGPTVARSQELVVLRGAHVARAAPSAHARRIEAVAARRPLTGVPTTLPLLGESVSGAWLHVLLPGRPNGHAGWISAQRTRATTTSWRIEVALSARRVTVFHDGGVIRRFRAVVGKPSTPTPRGRFFIEEALALGSAPGAPYALATSARSNALQEFEGGPGQIAIHGTRYLSGRPGTAASHGCIRLPTAAITWLAKRVGAGVPLTIGR